MGRVDAARGNHDIPRRFVIGGMYVEMKSRHIMNQDAPVFRDFIAVYAKITDSYEKTIVPQLVEADI